MTTKDRIAIMQAWTDGRQIEVRSQGRWQDVGPHGEPSWLSRNYRIKPKCRKISVSLFDADITKLDALMHNMVESHNLRIDRSTAIKLCIRMASRDPNQELVRAAWMKIRDEDGRR